MPKVVKSRLKVFICGICNNEFTVPYVGENNKTVNIKTCKNCLSERRRRSALSKEGIWTDMNKLYNEAKKEIVRLYNISNIVPKATEVRDNLAITTRTWTKMINEKGINYNILCEELGLTKAPRSKFSQYVLCYLHEIYKNKAIIAEKSFDGLRNPKTGILLNIDYFIPDLNLAIECDGKQHSNKNHYFNKLAERDGYTSVIETDKVKNKYCKENGIKLVRIPYSEKVNLEYVKKYVCI